MTHYYRARKRITWVLDIVAQVLGFAIAYRGRLYGDSATQNRSLMAMYYGFFLLSLFIYTVISALRSRRALEVDSVQETFFDAVVDEAMLLAMYLALFFVFRDDFMMSRIFMGLYSVVGGLLLFTFRMIYRKFCIYKTGMMIQATLIPEKQEPVEESLEEKKELKKQHVYIIGCKSLGQYGGFESFVMKLLETHRNIDNIRYHVACKANGDGGMTVEDLPGAERINDNEFTYYNAHGFLIPINEKLKSAQAITYDIDAFDWCCRHIEENHIEHPIVYILASRIGPFEKRFVKRVHASGGLVYQNPDGHENWRKKWSLPIRLYWKLSERLMVKNADLVICDSINIESYIQDEYSAYHPKTTYIPYGSNLEKSKLSDTDSAYQNWLETHNLRPHEYYLSVGRFVPENNFEAMIRGFMESHTKRDFAIITTGNNRFYKELEEKLRFSKDRRIKFVGTVYDQELLKKIRENAAGYLHGHEVGGTNPSLLESMGLTNVNLLYDVGFNREVAQEAAMYWNKEDESLARCINQVDQMSEEEVASLGEKARIEIKNRYTWEMVGEKYEKVFIFSD